ncbi:MAG: exo-alpha-sialidase [Acidiferrobacterales bacterium]
MAKRIRSLLGWPSLLLVLVSAVAMVSSQAETLPVSELGQSTHFHGIAVDRKDSSRIYLATHHGFFVVTTDGIATRVSDNKNDFMGFTPHPTDASVLYASGHPAGGGNMGFIVSTDGGQTWQQRAKGVRGPVDFHQMDVSKADPNTIYGVFGGLQVSRDSGRTWKLIAKMPDGLIDMAASAKFNRLYAATRQGLLITHDQGKTWQPAYMSGRPATMVQTTKAGDVYAFVVGVGLIRGTEPTLRWRVLAAQFGDQFLMHLAADPRNKDNLYTVTQKGKLLTSKDGGRTWAMLGTK